MWNLPGPGIQPVSPALAGRFFPTMPAGKLVFCISCLSQTSQARDLRNSWVSIQVCTCVWMHVSTACVPSHFSCVRLFATPWTVAYQAPLAMGFSRQECWSGSPFPFPGDLPDPGTETLSHASPALVGRFLPLAPPGKSCASTSYK